MFPIQSGGIFMIIYQSAKHTSLLKIPIMSSSAPVLGKVYYFKKECFIYYNWVTGLRIIDILGPDSNFNLSDKMLVIVPPPACYFKAGIKRSLIHNHAGRMTIIAA